MSGRTKRYLAAIGMFFVCCIVAWITSGTRIAAATNAVFANVRGVPLAVVRDNRITSNGSITGDSPVLLIANASDTASHHIQELKIANPDASDIICVRWTDTATACADVTFNCDLASGTAGQVGDVVLPGKVETFYVGGDRRTCGLSSSSPTTWHISRYQFQ